MPGPSRTVGAGAGKTSNITTAATAGPTEPSNRIAAGNGMGGRATGTRAATGRRRTAIMSVNTTTAAGTGANRMPARVITGGRTADIIAAATGDPGGIIARITFAVRDPRGAGTLTAMPACR